MTLRDAWIAAGALLLAASCATVPARPLPPRFTGIPQPAGLTYQPDRSLVIESPNAKAAHLVYRGRVGADRVAQAMRATLEASGWRHLSTSSDVGRPIVQAYTRAEDALMVEVTTGLWFTYLTLDVAVRQPAGPVASLGPESLGGAGPARPESAWQKLKDRSVALGRGVRDFFGSLFAD